MPASLDGQGMAYSFHRGLLNARTMAGATTDVGAGHRLAAMNKNEEIRLPFRMRAGASVGKWNGGGWLTIARQSVTFEFSRMSKIVYPFPDQRIRVRGPLQMV